MTENNWFEVILMEKTIIAAFDMIIRRECDTNCATMEKKQFEKSVKQDLTNEAMYEIKNDAFYDFIRPYDSDDEFCR